MKKAFNFASQRVNDTVNGFWLPGLGMPERIGMNLTGAFALAITAVGAATQNSGFLSGGLLMAGATASFFTLAGYHMRLRAEM